MTTDVFSKAEFEDALPIDKDTNKPLWKELGFNKGEYVYLVTVDNDNNNRTGVLVRSSVKANGFSAAAGEDSIRLYLMNIETKKPLAEKVDAWTQRTKGWEKRMIQKIRKLYKKGLKMLNCPKCNGVMLERDGKFGKFFGCSNYPACKHTAKDRAEIEASGESKDSKATLPQEPIGVIGEAKSKLRDMLLVAAEEGSETEPKTQDIEDTKIHLNSQQEQYVYAPIDENIRVVAGPGAGKTSATVERIVYLIEACNVNPEDIVYVTFTKAMATEGYNRIVARIPDVENTGLSKQICTIHALCYRMLMWEGINRNVPREWQVKKALNQFISGDSRAKIKGVWQYQEEKPGYKEVLYWIDRAKNDGVTPEDNMRFLEHYIVKHNADRVHAVRKMFDMWLDDNNYITFSDMVYMVEQMIIHDESFKNKYQRKFVYVFIDEAQDAAKIAMRILITLSLEPGRSYVYIK